jgi:hypothetical protein
MKVGSTIASDGGEPAGEVAGIAEGGELREGLQEDVLNEVFDVLGWDAREEDAVDHAGITRVEDTVGGAIAVLRGANEGDVSGRRIEPRIHGCDACLDRGEFIKCGHVGAIEMRIVMEIDEGERASVNNTKGEVKK